MRYILSAACILVCRSFVAIYISARVSIVQASFPLYVQEGRNLTLQCNSSDEKLLEWVMNTQSTGLNSTPVEDLLTPGGPYVTRYLVEKPSGYVESTFTKTNMRLQDGGMYQCRDAKRQNSFALWATVLSSK